MITAEITRLQQDSEHGPDRRHPIRLSAIVLLHTAASSRTRILS